MVDQRFEGTAPAQKVQNLIEVRTFTPAMDRMTRGNNNDPCDGWVRGVNFHPPHQVKGQKVKGAPERESKNFGQCNFWPGKTTL